MPLFSGLVREVSAVFFGTWDGPRLSRQEELGRHIPHRVVSEEELVVRRSGTQLAVLQPVKRFAHALQGGFEDIPILGKVRTDHLTAPVHQLHVKPLSTLPKAASLLAIALSEGPRRPGTRREAANRCAPSSTNSAG